MGYHRNLFGILTTLLSLIIFVAGNEPLNNKCDFSQGHQILTCINLNPKTSDLGNFIKADTYLLIVKGSSRIEIPSNYHNNNNFQHIRSYQLVSNGVLEISSFAFNELKNLRYLKISNNQQWSVLQSKTFTGLSGLETLNLVNNSIARLETHAFEGLRTLNILELMFNKFTVVPSFVFKPLQSLTSLFLYQNHIETLEDGCFEGLTEIELLDITHNKIKVVRASTFNGLSKLTDLYLSFNGIEAFEGELALPNLKFLFLQHNKLKSILHDMFRSVGNLETIDLSSNEISFIPDNTFYNLRSLAHVNLWHNNETVFANLNFSDSNKPLVTV